MKVDYIISFPERLLRAISVALGGAVYQLSLILLPDWVRGSRFYRVTFARMLRIIIEMIGNVQGQFPLDDMPVRDMATRKAAGNAVEVISFVAVGWSPVWLLAAAADVIGGTQAYLRLLVEDLKREGVLPPDTQIDSVKGLLASLEGTLGHAADTLDMPPLNLDDMRKSWRELQHNASRLPSADTLARIYDDLEAVADREGHSIYTTSSLIAYGALRTGITMGNRHIFDYYRDALDTIASNGLLHYIKRVSGPYRRMVVYHLDPHNQTHTERYLQRYRMERSTGSSNPNL